MCLKLLKCQVFCTSVFVIKLLDFVFFKKSICLLDVCLIKNFSMLNPLDSVLPALPSYLKDFVNSTLIIVCYTFKMVTFHFTNCLCKMCLSLFEGSILLMYAIRIQWIIIHFNVAVVFWRQLERSLMFLKSGDFSPLDRRPKDSLPFDWRDKFSLNTCF